MVGRKKSVSTDRLKGYPAIGVVTLRLSIGRRGTKLISNLDSIVIIHGRGDLGRKVISTVNSCLTYVWLLFVVS